MTLPARYFLSITIAVIVSMPGAGVAQTNDQPSAAERQAIRSCVSRAVQNNGSHLPCIGTVSRPCIDKPGNSSTSGMKLCLNRENAVWDQMLNENYQKLRKSLTPKGVKLLKDIQRTWIKWREAKCSRG
jgi:Lysozyme inhibitor LprI